ncbi:hypothetical protein EGW08_020419 [Elysia chlorotica]|uniref:Fibrinogen C-terminal domain-containing protein n=1 Tax=Elysia chlorotica TaxID=188477 RepID=A0A3S0ZCH3_ELYCH|nr:hypothetical protein EGW08_020419 [Elysia chlorotica]
MEGRSCVILTLCVSCCLGLDLSIDREGLTLTGARKLCAILTCTETAWASTTNKDQLQAGSAVSLKTISSMSVFKTVSREGANEKRETVIATVTTEEPSVTRVADGRKLTGVLESGRASVRVELIKPEDCQSEFTCQVRGVDSQGREAVSKASVVQQSDQGGNQEHGATLATVQLLASTQQLVAQSVASLEDKIDQLQGHFNDRSASLENRMEDKIGQLEKNLNDRCDSFENRMEDKIERLQKDMRDQGDSFGSKMEDKMEKLLKEMRDHSDSFERRVDNKFNLLENRLEDKIDNNNHLNKLVQMDVKVSTSLAEFRSEAKTDIVSSLDVLRREVLHELKQALGNISNDVKGTLNQTVDLVTSLGNNFDLFKSYGQTNLLSMKNETTRIRDMLTSRENFSHGLWNRTLDLNSELLESFKDLESNNNNSMAETRSEFKELLSGLESKISSDLKSLTDVVVPGECKKGAIPLITSQSQFVHYSEAHPKNSLNVSFLCDTFTDGGGWVVIQRRATGNTDFNRNWADYKQGFGSFADDFWLGNDKIHTITRTGSYELRVVLTYKGKTAYAHYDRFSIADELNGFKLRIGAYDGTAGDSLSYHNGNQFTTIDSDNDLHKPANCATEHGGGWWFRACDYSNLNGKWALNSDYGVEWFAFTGADSASFTMMEIRQV